MHFLRATQWLAFYMLLHFSLAIGEQVLASRNAGVHGLATSPSVLADDQQKGKYARQVQQQHPSTKSWMANDHRKTSSRRRTETLPLKAQAQQHVIRNLQNKVKHLEDTLRKEREESKKEINALKKQRDESHAQVEMYEKVIRKINEGERSRLEVRKSDLLQRKARLDASQQKTSAPEGISATKDLLPTVVDDEVNDTKVDHDKEYAIRKVSSFRWPDKTIRINMKNINAEQKALFYEVMDYLNELTCVKYSNVTGTYPELEVKSDALGCASNIGFRGRPTQALMLNADCYGRKGIIVHELLHSSGFHHQQTRPDRDDYIIVNATNVREGNMQNYRKMEGHYGFLMTMGVPYDYASLMQYPTWGFAKDSAYPTIIIKDKDYPFELGQRYTLTRTDIARLNRLYECRDHYLGDDILGAIPYDEWHDTYMKDFGASYVLMFDPTPAETGRDTSRD